VLLALLVCYGDALRKLLGTAPLSVKQLLLATASAVVLLALREIGKLIARNRAPSPSAVPALSRAGKDS
jgi:hypothetical protein